MEETRTSKTDCRTAEGITVGLIDAMIAIARVLVKRGDLHDQNSGAVRDAMMDLRSDDDISWLLTRKTAKEWEADRKAISLAFDGLNLNKKQID